MYTYATGYVCIIFRGSQCRSFVTLLGKSCLNVAHHIWTVQSGGAVRCLIWRNMETIILCRALYSDMCGFPQVKIYSSSHIREWTDEKLTCWRTIAKFSLYSNVFFIVSFLFQVMPKKCSHYKYSITNLIRHPFF